MITTLHIKNIGIIEDISVDFNEGLNALTGETGAGKTLMIQSLAMLNGGRFSKEFIRKGESYALVEACIYMPHSPFAQEGNIIVSREIHTSGKNICKMNGRLITVQELKNIMQDIVDIHGQHDNQKLMDASHHITYLDAFAGDEIQDLLVAYRMLYKQYLTLREELKEHFGDDKERQRTLDLLYYQWNEIEEAKLQEEEEEELEAKAKITQNAIKIAESLNGVEVLMQQQVLVGIEQAMKQFSKIDNLDKKYSEKLNQLQGIYYDLKEIGSDVNAYVYEMDFDEKNSHQIQERLDLIYQLKRKYGNTIPEILLYQKDVKEQIDTIENRETYRRQTKLKIKEIKEKMFTLAATIHTMRENAASILEEQVNQELMDLEMKHARFKVQLAWEENEKYHSHGLSQVSFYICTNAGDEYKPLVKIASGGEISRIMLAIKTVLAGVDQVPVMIFDEIDTGISGMAAKAVSEKLKKISQSHQILCITHLAVLAAKADYHYLIAKETVQDTTKTNIHLLHGEETLKEIARISTGQITRIAIEHALELRNA